MNNLIDFLTSKQIIYIYIVAFLACIICFIIYLVEKNNKKLRINKFLIKYLISTKTKKKK